MGFLCFSGDFFWGQKKSTFWGRFFLFSRLLEGKSKGAELVWLDLGGVLKEFGVVFLCFLSVFRGFYRILGDLFGWCFQGKLGFLIAFFCWGVLFCWIRWAWGF